MRRLLTIILEFIPIAGLGAGFLTWPASAEIYHWFDASGGEHFSLDLNEVPPAYRVEAEERAAEAERRFHFIGSGDKERGNSGPAAPLPRFHSLIDRPGGRDEGWWRREWQRHQSSVAGARREVETVRTASVSPGNVVYSARNRARRQWDRNKQRRDNQRERSEKLVQATSALSRAERAKAEFAERARRMGVPPGWIRD